MNLFRKFFGSISDSESDENTNQSPYIPTEEVPTDELFTNNFIENGGKFIYCENPVELQENFVNILVENDWFEKDVICNEEKLMHLLKENNLNKTTNDNANFIFTTCESLIADDGAVLFSSSQIQQKKPNDLPVNFVVYATTSQIVKTKSDGMCFLKNKYTKEYPSNITTITNYNTKHVGEQDFLNYGNNPKNLYLLLLEDL